MKKMASAWLFASIFVLPFISDLESVKVSLLLLANLIAAFIVNYMFNKSIFYNGNKD